MKFVNIKLKLFYFIIKIIKMLYSLLIKNNKIIYLINSTLNMFKMTDSVNVTEILNFKENKCIFNEL